MLQIVQDWVHKFNVHRLKGLIARSPPAQRSRFMDQHRRHLIKVIEIVSIPAAHAVVSWRLKNSVHCLQDGPRTAVNETTLSREL
jgi:hypothetical protein